MNIHVIYMITIKDLMHIITVSCSQSVSILRYYIHANTCIHTQICSLFKFFRQKTFYSYLSVFLFSILYRQSHLLKNESVTSKSLVTTENFSFKRHFFKLKNQYELEVRPIHTLIGNLIKMSHNRLFSNPRILCFTHHAHANAVCP